MSRKSADRMRSFRQRRKKGIAGMVRLPLERDVAGLLMRLGYVSFPSTRELAAAGLVELLRAVRELPPEVLARLAKPE